MDSENKGSKIFGVLILLVVTFVFGVIMGRNVIPTSDGLFSFDRSKNVDFGLFWNVWDMLERKYVEKDTVSEEEKLFGAIKGLVSSYNDPATIFLDPEETKDFNASNEGKLFEGIGAELGYDEGAIIVVTPIEGSPAKAAGIRPGDYILAVDDYELKSGENVYSIVQRIRGEAGTVVKLKILHRDEFEPVDIEITRGEITVPSITLSYIGEKRDIALIDVSRFTESSLEEWNSKWDSTVHEIVKADVEKIILDLRSNPGGYFNAAIYAADEFLPAGKVIAKQEDSKGRVQVYDSSKKGELIGKSIVVLVNEGSASSAEILAGALQQNSVATIVGTKTYGKGTAQNIENFSNGSSLHVTVLKWLLPDGTWLSREHSVTPDIEVELTSEDFVKGVDTQLDKALEYINK